jgi:hypothetical protein
LVISTLLENRRVKIGLIAVVSCLIIYAGILTWMDKVHRAENTINQFWSLLDRVCAERLALLPQFASFIRTSDPQAQPLADGLMRVYNQTRAQTFSDAALNDPNALQSFANQQQNVATILHQTQMQLAPQASQSQSYLLLNQALEEREMQIQFAVHAISKQIVYYNRLIYGVPQRWFNKTVTHFPPKYFPEVPTLEGIQVPKR